jgi:ribosomal protein S18 acetylase RimI-like enzyme
MQFRRLLASELHEVYELLAANGWRERVGTLEQFSSLISASQLAEVAVLDGRVVGFVRAITDGLSNGYLSMLVVAPEHRRKGVGRQLVEHALGSNSKVTWVLRAGRDGSSEFFSKLGFVQSVSAMERPRE